MGTFALINFFLAVSRCETVGARRSSRTISPYEFIECCLQFMPARVFSSLLFLGTSYANRCLLVCAVRSLTLLRYAEFGWTNDSGKSID